MVILFRGKNARFINKLYTDHLIPFCFYSFNIYPCDLTSYTSCRHIVNKILNIHAPGKLLVINSSLGYLFALFFDGISSERLNCQGVTFLVLLSFCNPLQSGRVRSAALFTHLMGNQYPLSIE